MKTELTKLWQVIDEQHDVSIDLLRSLVKRVPQGENAVQAYVSQCFAKLGAEVVVIDHQPRHLDPKHEIISAVPLDNSSRRTVVGRLRSPGNGRSLLLFAHPDNEPIDGVESWTFDPFAGIIGNGRMHGWGIADDLLGVAVMIAALKAVLASGYTPAGEIVLASTPSKRRAQGIIAVLDNDYTADAAIYLHPAESGAGLADIKAFTSGLLRFRITVPGKPPDTLEPVHTPFYHLAVDPLEKAWRIYHALQLLAEKRSQEIYHPLIESVVGRSTNLQIAYMHCGDENKLSRVSQEAVLAGSITFPPTESMIAVQEAITQAVQQAAAADEWLKIHPPQIDWLMGSDGVEIDQESALYQTVKTAISDTIGQIPGMHPLHSASDIRNPMLYKGIPTVGFGSLAGNLTQAGHVDEWIDIEDYISMVKVVAAIIVKWCGKVE